MGFVLSRNRYFLLLPIQQRRRARLYVHLVRIEVHLLLTMQIQSTTFISRTGLAMTIARDPSRSQLSKGTIAGAPTTFHSLSKARMTATKTAQVLASSGVGLPMLAFLVTML